MIPLTRRRLAGLLAAALVAGVGAGVYGAGRLSSRPAAWRPDAVPFLRVASPESSTTFRQVAAAVRPAVININTVTVVRNPLAGSRSPMEEFFGEDLFRRFFGEPRELRQKSLGSGVIVDPSGTALTNAHVVEGATDIEIVTADGQKHKARVLGTDPKSDVPSSGCSARPPSRPPASGTPTRWKSGTGCSPSAAPSVSPRR